MAGFLGWRGQSRVCFRQFAPQTSARRLYRTVDGGWPWSLGDDTSTGGCVMAAANPGANSASRGSIGAIAAGTYLPFPMAGTALFKTVSLDDAVKCHDLLCQARVLTRRVMKKTRFGLELPANESQWAKLEGGVNSFKPANEDISYDVTYIFNGYYQ
ncbi:hypothetical protein P4S72_00795 [Vibrio sp. PP-XX7]